MAAYSRARTRDAASRVLLGPSSGDRRAAYALDRVSGTRARWAAWGSPLRAARLGLTAVSSFAIGLRSSFHCLPPGLTPMKNFSFTGLFALDVREAEVLLLGFIGRDENDSRRQQIRLDRARPMPC